MSRRYQGGFDTASYNGLQVPNAPTIGTATGGNASASVTFTAPSNVGGGAITGYTVISSPGGITGTGASSPVTVSGLTNGTAYTFTVVATNAYGTGPTSAASNSVTPALAIGSAYGGGFFAGQISTTANGVATHNLVICDVTVGQFYGKTWGPSPVSTSATSVIDGPANSAALAALGASYQAATFCEAINTGGYTDWYMPAQNELEVCYYFLKPSTTDNFVYNGENANAVSPEPISTAYTSSVPGQTTATNFRTGASSQEFASGTYWTSTEYDATYAWYQHFGGGQISRQNYNSKGVSSYYVRAVRRVAV